MVARSSLIFSSITLLFSFAHAYGQIAQVVDANNFCVFLPPADSVDRGIADTEWNAEAFCIGKTPLATNAGKLNSGFIQSAHFVKTDAYVQVTGQINPSKAKLLSNDEGGQYDIKAPRGSSCAGWKYYVNLVEPAGNTFCMRCCNDDRTCNRGISEKGCAHIIPGDYSGPLGDKGSSDPSPNNSVKTTTIKANTTSKTKTKTKTKTTTNTILGTGTATAKAVVPTPAVDPKLVAAGTSSSVSSTPVITPASPAIASTSAPANSPNVEVLSQQKVTEQSVSGAEVFSPSMITLAFLGISMALMHQ